MADDPWVSDEQFRDGDSEPFGAEVPLDFSAPMAWLEEEDLDAEDEDFDTDEILDSLVQSLGRPEAIDRVQWLGCFSRGDPESAIVMRKLRDLRDSGTLSHNAHFFIVTEIMEDLEFESADGDAETMELLKQIRVLSREYEASRAPDDDADWELERAPEELRDARAEWSMRCRLAWLDWLRELGEEEVAQLAERDEPAYQRRRIAGEREVYGSVRPPPDYRPSRDGYCDPPG